MRRKAVKILSDKQLSQIKELYDQGKNIDQMRRELNLPTNTLRYYVERIILEAINDPALIDPRVEPKIRKKLETRKVLKEELENNSALIGEIVTQKLRELFKELQH